MTANMAKLVEDAIAAGYTVEIKPVTKITITRRLGPGKGRDGLCIYENHTALNLTFDLGGLTGLRNYSCMRRALGI